MAESRMEQAIANVEMCCSVIGLQAERIGKVAAKLTDDVQRLELWSVTTDLAQGAKMIREQLLALQHSSADLAG